MLSNNEPVIYLVSARVLIAFPEPWNGFQAFVVECSAVFPPACEEKTEALDPSVKRGISVQMLWRQKVAKKRRRTRWVRRGFFVIPFGPNGSCRKPRLTDGSRVISNKLTVPFYGSMLKKQQKRIEMKFK